jgi:AcrR family transcriptional regulator
MKWSLMASVQKKRAAGPGTDRRRAKTRSALLHAGRALLAHRDVEGLSVDEIVTAADVAKGSFYNHFADKDLFAREIGAAVRRQAEEAVDAANRDVTDPAVGLARALCVFVRFAMEHPDGAQVLWRLNSGATIADAPVNRGLRDQVERIRRGGECKELDVEAGVLLVMGAFVITMRHVLEERAVTPPALIAARMGEMLLRGLGLPLRRARAVAARAAAELIAAAP